MRAEFPFKFRKITNKTTNNDIKVQFTLTVLSVCCIFINSKIQLKFKKLPTEGANVNAAMKAFKKFRPKKYLKNKMMYGTLQLFNLEICLKYQIDN